MKKTIAILLSLGGMAMGESTSLVNVMQSGNSTQGGASVDVWGEDALSLSDVSATVTITNATGAKNAFTTTYAQSVFAVNGTNVGSGGTFTYTLTFTTDFAAGVSAVTLDSFTFDLFTLNGSGKTQNNANDKSISYDYVLNQQGTTLRSQNDTVVALGGGYQTSAQGGTSAYSYDSSTDVYTRGVYGTEKVDGMSDSVLLSGGEVKIDFADNPVVLLDNTVYSLSLDVERTVNDGYYLGFGNVSLNGSAVVPEPATTALSLLAFAGLAARRRRK